MWKEQKIINCIPLLQPVASVNDKQKAQKGSFFILDWDVFTVIIYIQKFRPWKLFCFLIISLKF